MPKAKAPTPQELYRQRKEREEQEKTAYLPPGLINHGNTCFMNSVLQGLIATRLLSDLVHFYPIPAHIQAKAATPILPQRSPQLTNGHNIAGLYEQPWVNMMPIGDMFLSVLYRAWGMQSRRQKEVLSPKSLLSALGQKYDQYLDFAQQDAHEFLRILLDAMRMEEQDVIKKRQPPPHTHHKKRRRTTITPSNLLYTPALGSSNTSSAHSGSSTAPQHSEAGPSSSNDFVSPTSGSPSDPTSVPLLSFADMLFGGQLTSILVCQKCKHISQTYEDFNDISLSIKAEDYYSSASRKRDRFKNLAKRLAVFPTPGSSNSGKDKNREKTRSVEPERVPANTSSISTSSAPVSPPTTQAPQPSAAASTRPPATRPPIAPFHALEIQRSSSVPPSPSVERPGGTITGGHDEPPVLIVERRRSLDLGLVRKMSQKGDEDGSTTTATNTAEDGEGSVGDQDEGFVTPDERFEIIPSGSSPAATKEDDKQEEKDELSSSSSHVIVNITGPDDRHVEFVEPALKDRDADGEKEAVKESSDKDSDKSKDGHKEKEKEKKVEEAAWTKIGRRISLTMGGLGRRTASDKKERERKSRSMDRSSLMIKEEGKEEDGPAGQTNSVVASAIQMTAAVGISAPTTGDPAPSSESSSGEQRKLSSGPSTTSLSTSVNKFLKPLPARPVSIAQDSKPPSRTSTPPPATTTPSTSAPSLSPITSSPSGRGRTSPSSPLTTSAPPISAPTTSTSSTTSSSRPLSRFPHVLPPRRSKSPNPPKPSSGEVEYLRRILADIGTASFGGSPIGGVSGSAPNLNPFSLLHRSSARPGHSEGHDTSANEEKKVSPSSSAPAVPIPLLHSTSSSPASWLGFGVGPHLSGIEECLRMFTSVEVLDGENMVGCRRCWKIENGMLGKGKDKKGVDEDDQDSDEEKDEDTPPGNHRSDAPSAAGGAEEGILGTLASTNHSHHGEVKTAKARQHLPVLTSIAASMLSPSFDAMDPISELSALKEPGNAMEQQPVIDHQSMSLAIIPPTPLDATHPTPKGASFEIPVISTTSPEPPVFDPANLSDQETPLTDRDSAYARLTGTSSASNKVESSPKLSSRTVQALYGTSSGSKDSLVIPSVRHVKSIRRRSNPTSQVLEPTQSQNSAGSGTDKDEVATTTTEDDDSELESDTSVGTSVSASSSRGDTDAVHVPPPMMRATSSLVHSKTIRRPSMPPHGSSTSSPAVPSRANSLGLSSSTPTSTTFSSTLVGSPHPRVASTSPKASSSKPPKPPKPVIMRPAYKRYLIATAPPVLVVHLKRFQQTSKTAFYSTFSHGFKKLDDYVSFPEYLDLTPFLAPKKEDYGLGKKNKAVKKEKEKERARVREEERCVYRLYGVVVHIGNMLGGHYIAYTALPDSPPVHPTAPPAEGSAAAAKTSAPPSVESRSSMSGDESNKKPKQRQWAYISDTVVRLTTLEEVLHAKAYICMYERVL